jgi:putative ABC transport system ATP-binding protein
MEPAETMVEANGIGYAYREGSQLHPVLSNLSLTVPRGELVALLGRSGSGKSTLLHLLGCLDRPQDGIIRIDGYDLGALGDRKRTLFRRSRIGFVYQGFNLIPTLTAAENVGLPLDLCGMDTRRAEARVDEILDAVGLLSRSPAFPDQLSGGEQQRVAIARALVHRPSLVLADEPTGNLDADTGELVLGLLSDLARRYQQTLVLVTHSRAVAAKADRVLTLVDGALRPGGLEDAW